MMIANEMNRAAALHGEADRSSLLHSYERVLRLVDLTIEVNAARGLRHELLRWRDLVATLYAGERSDPRAHREAFLALLLLSPATARQIPFVRL